jgi:hypothetical protein
MQKTFTSPKYSWPGVKNDAGQAHIAASGQSGHARVKNIREHDTSIPGVVAKVVEFDRKFSDRPYREARNKRQKKTATTSNNEQQTAMH